MNFSKLETDIGRLEKEFQVAGNSTDKALVDLRVEVDRLKVEIKALKTFLDMALPEFQQDYPPILAKTLQEFNPEFD